eukprot:358671-Chlamydomonas_euryale.AAC.5
MSKGHATFSRTNTHCRSECASGEAHGHLAMISCTWQEIQGFARGTRNFSIHSRCSCTEGPDVA